MLMLLRLKGPPESTKPAWRRTRAEPLANGFA
jgi:hypothetical protein